MNYLIVHEVKFRHDIQTCHNVKYFFLNVKYTLLIRRLA